VQPYFKAALFQDTSAFSPLYDSYESTERTTTSKLNCSLVHVLKAAHFPRVQLSVQGGGNKQDCFTRRPHQQVRNSCIGKTFRLPAPQPVLHLRHPDVLVCPASDGRYIASCHCCIRERYLWAKENCYTKFRVTRCWLARKEPPKGGHVPCWPHL